MEFSSLEECLNFIKQAVASGMNPMGEEMKRIMQEAVESDIYEDHSPTMYQRTNQLKEAAQIAETTDKSVETEYMNNGNWPSFDGTGSYFPIEAYKNGTVIAPGGGRYSADPTETASHVCEEEIPRLFKEYLRSQGIPVE